MQFIFLSQAKSSNLPFLIFFIQKALKTYFSLSCFRRSYIVFVSSLFCLSSFMARVLIDLMWASSTVVSCKGEKKGQKCVFNMFVTGVCTKTWKITATKHFRHMGFGLLQLLVLPVAYQKTVKARKDINDYRENNYLSLDEDPQSFIFKPDTPAKAFLLKKCGYSCWINRWLQWNRWHVADWSSAKQVVTCVF